MNSAQRAVILLGVLLTIITGLYPPWIHTLNVTIGGDSVQREEFAGYSWFLDPPSVDPGASQPFNPHFWTTRIDIKRLALQGATICLAVGGLFWR